MNITSYIFSISSLLGTNFHLKQAILNFWIKFAPKKYLCSKTWRMNITIEFSIFKQDSVQSLILSRQLCVFGPNFTREGSFGPKQKKVYIIIIIIIKFSGIRISLDINFHLRQTIFDFFVPYLLKKDVSCPKQDKWTLPPNSTYWN